MTSSQGCSRPRWKTARSSRSFPSDPERAAYKKFGNPASRYAIVGVFVAKLRPVRVAVTGAGSCVFRVPAMEAALAKSFAADALSGIEMTPARLTRTSMVRRNIAQIWSV